MVRYKLIIEYDGRPYVGWQRQSDAPSVQQSIEGAIFKLCGEECYVTGAGRTDTGVHATGQVGHVDLPRWYRPDTVRDGLNALLVPHPIAIISAEERQDGFDARFSAKRRHYVYRILNRRAPPAMAQGFVWHIKRALDADAMHAAAQQLVGHHDFSTFRDSDCQANSPMRTLDQIEVVRIGDVIEIRTSAQSFLHRQVRSMVGSLEHVGSGKWDAADLWRIFQSRERAACGTVAPPDGLCLVHVDY